MLRQPDCDLKIGDSEVRWGSEWGGGEVSLVDKTNASLKLRYCLEALADQHGNILEIGCGQGRFLRAVRNSRKGEQSYVGCDINIENLRKVRAITGDHGDIHLCAGNLSRLPFADDSFDAVVFFDVLEHVQSAEESVRELNRIMKQGGLLHAFIPCEGNLWTFHGLLSKLGIGRNLKRKLAGHLRQFKTAEVLNLFHHYGFRLERIRYSGYALEQFFDLAFYTALQVSWLHSILARAHTESSPASDNQRDSGFKKLAISFFRAVKNILFGIAYYESLLLSKVPYSLGVHATFRKGNGPHARP